MPKVLFTAVVADMRGSLAGSTFSRNSGGSFLRTKTSPVGQRTNSQLARSSEFISLTSSWRGLTEEQRTEWRQFAKNISNRDVFGNDNKGSGFTLYVKLNTKISIAGGTRIDSPIPFVPMPSVLVSNPRIDASTTGVFRITTTGQLPSEDWVIISYGGRDYPPGREISKKGLSIWMVNPIVISTGFIIGGYQATFGNPALTARRIYMAEFINKVTGQSAVQLISDIAIQ